MINDNYFYRSPRTGLAGSWVMAAACETARFPCGGRVGHECTGSAIARESDVQKEIGGSGGGARASRPAAGAAVAAASPTCELLSVSGPEAITASTETFTAHIFSRARVATTSPSLRKPRARLPHSVNVPKRTFTPFGLLRLQNPQQRPPNGASSNEQPSEPARIVDVERQKYLTPNNLRDA